MNSSQQSPTDGAHLEISSSTLWDYLASHPVGGEMEAKLSVFYVPEFQSSLTRNSTSAAARTTTGPSRPEGRSGEPGL